MDLRHRFTVPAGMDEAWTAFNDLERLAPCFPGATITRVEGNDFAGSVKIKLGPISLLYSGSGRYAERDETERRVVIEARGKDKRGNGTATATVTASFTASSSDGGETDVDVVTDLVITGKPAQFGRGVISDVSDKLLDQFVSCVSDQFAESSDATEPSIPTEESSPEATAEQPSSAPIPEREPPPAVTTPSSDRPPPREAASAELNLASTLVPVLLKRYGPAIAAVGLLLFVVIKIIRRKR
jgi:uncharacterized protein